MLAIERLIRDRLAAIPDVPGGVSSVAELSMEAVAGRRFPALFVGADGYRVEDDKSPGAIAVASRWLVIVAVRHVGDARGGSAARDAASDLATEVMARLYRWQPPGHKPLMAAAPPKPDYATGVLLYPLAFEAIHIINRKE
ncbi:hypothetical protein LJB71_14880 [Thermomonas sp. S9]|uniref:phage tail terminator protein n=1 Tax=Thermomonas sp. S9 TaxID=2885203 RepID=UPI00216B1090|nr:hypothetical protein [Thermomonas sp. S9]MCR6497086.1 hypothetical protein [Thermomonas sp. S9]MCR6497370.1 hypothetical protein [Thermomonas sp. S9]